MKKAVVVFMVFFVMVFMASVAFAEEGPCAADMAKFCKNVKPGEGRQSLCLKKYEAQLSPACKKHVQQVTTTLSDAQKICQDDITAYCAGVKPGGGRIAECLKANKDRLSSKCKAKVTEDEKKMK